VLGKELLEIRQVLGRGHDVGGSALDGIGPEVEVPLGHPAKDLARVFVQSLSPQNFVSENGKHGNQV